MKTITTKKEFFEVLTHETGHIIDCNRMSVSESVAIIEKEAGTHFDTKVVTAFKHCLPLALLRFQKKLFQAGIYR